MSKRFRYSNYDMFKPEAEYCNGKRAYDKKGAQTAANLRWKQAREELRIYQCEEGDHWHLTKQMRRQSNPDW